MNKEAALEAIICRQFLHLLPRIAAIGVADGSHHDHLGVLVCREHPLRDVRDVVHPLLLHPTADKDKDAGVLVLAQEKALLHGQLRKFPPLHVATLALLGHGHALRLGHAVLDARNLGEAPEDRVLLHRLEGVVTGDCANAVAALVPSHVVHHGLQHGELALGDCLLRDAGLRQVEDLREPLRFPTTHVLRGDGALVLSIVQD
mmetsp:Transcript_79259/g.169839  ORF Transcript_79259/g.169839 Transcript_79259/m.169839 type:complete len:203 (-) Transcript_79259:1007-1615(-)